ncbi:MAG: 50S ribosomal protein L18 [Candidatus Peribacteraceae bacterium]|jgi:large subunit ribosomal protein L18|nr:50S ribosomal protein L18 [bacterium]MDP6561766.1 50S ribosomal protein L18 [Candidatus Peribacteraceae bacterium]|tara:strand:- start:6165 stop:6512 length:348 start_codon:yes stop_codon:yes gene_type:complete
MKTPKKVYDRQARKRRVRAKVSGTLKRPRLSVFRSLLQISAQLIDDETGKTLATATTKQLKAKPNIEGAAKLGEAIAAKAKDAKITTVVFDRNSYQYHGRVKAVAEAARKAGLTF